MAAVLSGKELRGSDSVPEDDIRALSVLRDGAAKFGVALSADQIDAFQRYRSELLEWNATMNLTAIVDPIEVETKHFVDSLACLLVPFPFGATVLDVGSGAGFPGLALKIARPDLRLTLLEATGKKGRFMRHVADVLALHDVEVLVERAENAAGREGFDIVVARAVAAFSALLELTLPFARVGGRTVSLKKGAGLESELQASTNALQVLGGRLDDGPSYLLDGERRRVLVVTKVRSTPGAYPRRPGMPAKRPL